MKSQNTKCFAALLKREFRISRKANILKFALCSLWLLMIWLVMVSIKTDSKLRESVFENNSDFIKNAPTAITIFIIFFINMSNSQGNNHKSDLASRWQFYSYTLPVSPFMRTTALFSCRLILSFAGIILSIANAVFCAAYWDTGFNPSVPAYAFLVTTLLAFWNLPVDFFLFRARNEIEYKKQSGLAYFGMVMLMSLFFFAVFKVAGIGLSDVLDSEKNSAIHFPAFSLKDLFLIVPLFIVVETFSFVLLYRSLKKPYGITEEKAMKVTSGEDPAVGTSVKNEKNTLPPVGKKSPKGLFYLEFSRNKILLFLCIFLPFFCLLLPFIANFSDVFFGNKSVSDMFMTATNPFVMIAMYLLGFAGINMAMGILFSGDTKKLFAYFIASTPGGVKKYVRNKYFACVVFNLIFHISCLLAYTLLYAVNHLMLNEELSSSRKVYLYGIFAILFISSIELPLFFRFGAKRASMIKLLVILGCGILFTIVFALISERAQENLMATISNLMQGIISPKIKKALKTAPFIATILYLLSLRLSESVYLKGAEEYY